VRGSTAIPAAVFLGLIGGLDMTGTLTSLFVCLTRVGGAGAPPSHTCRGHLNHAVSHISSIYASKDVTIVKKIETFFDIDTTPLFHAREITFVQVSWLANEKN